MPRLEKKYRDIVKYLPRDGRGAFKQALADIEAYRYEDAINRLRDIVDRVYE